MTAPSAEELRELCFVQELSTCEIGKRYNVAQRTARRWLKRHAISLRPARPTPAREELERLIYIDRLTYREVGKKYCVDHSTVPLWLDRFGIPRPSRTRIDDLGRVKALYESGLSAQVIAGDLGCSKSTILSFLHQMGVSRRSEGWRGLVRAKDGQLVRSTYEARVAGWLAEHGVAYEYEPRVPFGHGNTRADFYANGWYIEVWGVHSSAAYKRKRDAKIAAYRGLGLPLIELRPNHFSARDGHLLEHRLTPCLRSA